MDDHRPGGDRGVDRLPARALSKTSRWNFSDLRALFVSCTLKPSPEPSHTEGLMRISMAIKETNGVEVDFVRAVDHELAPGVLPDMTEHGAARDDWPALYVQELDSVRQRVGSARGTHDGTAV